MVLPGEACIVVEDLLRGSKTISPPGSQMIITADGEF